MEPNLKRLLGVVELIEVMVLPFPPGAYDSAEPGREKVRGRERVGYSFNREGRTVL